MGDDAETDAHVPSRVKQERVCSQEEQLCCWQRIKRGESDECNTPFCFKLNMEDELGCLVTL